MIKKSYIVFSILILMLLIYSCGNNEAQTKAEIKKNKTTTDKKDSTKTATVTKVIFIELGSVNCIPCKKMQPVMKAVEEDFGEQLKVVFYDVWKDNAPAKKYGIRLIPTQVFLDETGEEFFRHEGFFSKEEIDKLLIDKGLKKIKKVKKAEPNKK